jgi:predicted permease
MFTGLRFAFRQLIKTPGFAATALSTLALCLGANLTIYAVVDAILIRSLPFPEPSRLVTMFNCYPAAGVPRASASLSNYLDRRGMLPAFSSISLNQDTSTIVGLPGSPNRVFSAQVTPEFFSTLGVTLAQGRSFTDAELTYQTDGEAVITDEFWHSQFAGDPNVLGRTFMCNGYTVTVIGLLPRDFRFLSSRALFYRPASFGKEQVGPANRHSNNWQMVGRLAPGATLAEAQSQINAFNLKQLADDPYAQIVKGSGYYTQASPLQKDFVKDARPMLLLLQCGGLLLLVIGGVNIANLLLIRASGRTKEVAVRQALGASRYHIARDVLTETVLLALLGGVFGLILGAFGIRMLGLLGTDSLPLGSTVRFDGRVAAVSLAASLAVGVLLALPITWFNVRTRLQQGLQSETRGGTSGRGAHIVRNVFIVAQVALAFILLSGAGLLGISLKRVLETPAGFRPDNILTGSISLPYKNYKDDVAKRAFVESLVSAVKALPGVTHAAVIAGMPFSGGSNDSATAIEGWIPKPGESLRAHYQCATTPDYWSLMGIPLLEGRFIEERDNQKGQMACVVDKAFADRYWPTESPLGHRLTMGPTFDAKTAYTVIGVVGNVKQNGLAETGGHGTVYYPFATGPANGFQILAKTQLPAASIAPMLRKAVLALDPDLPVDYVQTMQARIDDSVVARRSPAILAGIFSGVALLLAAIGTYGVLAYAVSQRKREIGVRMALGAQPGQVLALFLRLGATLLGTGVVLGVLGSWASGRAMQGVLFGVGAVNLGVLAATTAVMVVVVFLAVLVPSRRAARVNPLTALRDD